MKALERIIEQAAVNRKRIVMPESQDERIIEAAVRASTEGIADIVLLGNSEEIAGKLTGDDDVSTGISVIDPPRSAQFDQYVDALYELRKHKGLTLEQAKTMVSDPLVYGAMMVRQGDADGMVAGAVNTTADVVRTAIQVVGVAEGVKLVSSFFLMMLCKPFHNLKGGIIFSDCALVVQPDDNQLAEIAMAAADSARNLLMEEPRVAMLSFSTAGSAEHTAVSHVTEATRIVKDKQPDLVIDGDIQLDAAIVAEISEKKFPDAQTSGRANVLVFPDLDAGNIGYKMAERIGQADAIGPLMQGLARPVNDLSRGCSVDDVFYVIAVTAVQAQARENG